MFTNKRDHVCRTIYASESRVEDKFCHPGGSLGLGLQDARLPSHQVLIRLVCSQNGCIHRTPHQKTMRSPHSLQRIRPQNIRPRPMPPPAATSLVPSGVYTIPEIACVGLSQSEAASTVTFGRDS